MMAAAAEREAVPEAVDPEETTRKIAPETNRQAMDHGPWEQKS